MKQPVVCPFTVRSFFVSAVALVPLVAGFGCAASGGGGDGIAAKDAALTPTGDDRRDARAQADRAPLDQPRDQADVGAAADTATTVSDVGSRNAKPGAEDVGVGGGPAKDGGAAPNDGGVAQALAGFRWDVPCAQAAFVTAELCTGPRALDWAKTFGGDPATIYEVTLRFRGLVEPRVYLDAAGKRIATVTSAPYFGSNVKPDPGSANYGSFGLDVDAPKGSYYLNVFHTTDGAFHHQLLPIDYTATVKIKGGAALKMSYRDGNTEFVANFKKVVVPGVAPAPNPYNGQFVQVDVVAVKASD